LAWILFLRCVRAYAYVRKLKYCAFTHVLTNRTSLIVHPATALAYFKQIISTGFPNLHSDTKLAAKDIKDTKTLAKSPSPRPESNGRRPGPGFRKKSANKFELDFAYPSNSGATHEDRACSSYDISNCSVLLHVFIMCAHLLITHLHVMHTVDGLHQATPCDKYMINVLGLARPMFFLVFYPFPSPGISTIRFVL